MKSPHNLNRLTSYKSTQTNKTENLDYDSRGNILKSSANYANKDYEYTSSRPHAVTKVGDEQFLYDANGNMISDAHRGMTYNAQNQLQKVVMTNGTIVEYEYDYTGARVLKKSTVKDPIGKIIVSQVHYLGETLEIKNKKVHLHINIGSQRVASKGLGDLNTLSGIGAGTLRNNNIISDGGVYIYTPWLMLAGLLFVLASLRPVQTPLTLWSRYTQSLHEALNKFHVRGFAKTVCMILVFSFVTLQPLTQIAFAGDTGAPAKPIDDEKYFVYYQKDHLGSTNIITEGKASSLHSGITYQKGSLIQRIEYSPYGQEQFVLNPNLKFDPRYTGQQYDVETGLYYYKARYYNPVLARFIQADTLVPDAKNLQAFNRYAYAANNPLKYTDPSGHGFWSWFKKLAGVFVGALISVLSFGLLLPAGATLASISLTQAVVFGALSGMAGGLVGGAITGGLNGMLMGALFGFLGGAFTAGLGHGIAGITDKVVRGVVSGIMMGAGAGLSYAQGGWQGLLSFGVGLLGATAGSRLVGPIKTGLAKMREGSVGGASHQTLLDSVVADQVGGDISSTNPVERMDEGPIGGSRGGGGGTDFVVDPNGNAVPLKPGETFSSSPDGKYIQVKGADMKATGVRIDGGHNPSVYHQDPRSLVPHAHIPGVTNPDGTPWLPVKY